jgi:hypothetical protein
MRWGVLYILYSSLFFSTNVSAQSVPFSQGKWVKIAVSKQGFYQVSGSQLKTWGLTVPFASSQLQLFNLNTANLVEKVTANMGFGLNENAIEVQDGGDGQFDNQDYFLFYSQGNIQWKWNGALQFFEHSKNAHGDSVYYFISLGKDGKRIQKPNSNYIANATTDIFDERWVMEKDTINILNSGQIWWGPAMGLGVGKQAKITTTLNMEGLVHQTDLIFKLNYAAASTASNANFELTLNDQKLRTTGVAPISGYIYDDAANVVLDTFRIPFSSNLLNTNLISANLGVGYLSANASSTGWINYVTLQAKRKIGFYGGAKSLGFRNASLVGTGKIIQYQIKDADASTKIWEVTRPENPVEMPSNFQNGVATFIQNADSLREFFSVTKLGYETPSLVEVLNIDYPSLLNTPAADYIIITAANYLKAADSLAKFHAMHHGLSTFVTNTGRVFNEFSGGQPSPIGIRNYVKYIYDKAKKNNTTTPKYLLLLGIGNFDYKKIDIQTQVPSYESLISNSVLSSYATDDFFAILKEGDDINTPQGIQSLALSVGRLPVKNAIDAEVAVKKLIQYQTGKNLGAWRNQLTWVADDGDYNLHLEHAEEISTGLKLKQPTWNQKKIYLDLFPAINSSAGNTYPLANNLIKQMVNNGTLILNYTGHGNYTRLAEEAVITQNEIMQWDNAGKLPLMVTASCDFAPFDQPQISPIGFDALVKNQKGIIGLVAASRLVFAFNNKEINDEFVQQLLVPDQNDNYKSIGAALQNAKSNYWKKGSDYTNAFKFNLMGDPALQLAKPSYGVTIGRINQKVFNGKDTLKAGGKYQVAGTIKANGNLLTNFDGLLEFTLFDIPKKQKTLANISSSIPVNITAQDNILFKGNAIVSKGLFSVDFILPKEVAINQGALRMQLYATNSAGNADAIGVYDSLFVNAFSENISTDTTGPVFEKIYINDTLNQYKQKTWISANSNLYINLKDSSGIQTSGNSLGHDISLVIDGETQSPLILNNYYTADVNTYQSGKIKYALPALSEGPHQLIIKAWDLIGNSNKDTLNVIVPNSRILSLKNLTNYPNPVGSSTRFSFEISQLREGNKSLIYTIEIYNNIGIKQLSKTFEAPLLNRVVLSNVVEVGSLPAGTYFYKLIVKDDQQEIQLTNKFLKY